MWARARAQSGFTTIELLLAVMIASVGVISLIGTFDVSRRVTSYSEMKEAASHIAEQKIEELRAFAYGELALDGSPVPSGSSDPDDPAYYLGSGGTTYRPDHKSTAVEPLLVDATHGKVPAAAEGWSDGRIHGNVYRYVTCAAATAVACDQGPDTTAYKRVTVAVTVDNKFGPKKPILVSTLVANPETANGVGANPGESPNTTCGNTGQQCTGGISGTVSTWYLYDTLATQSARQEIAGSHPTHPTVAPSGTCAEGTTSGCPVPDLMGLQPPPAPGVTPPLYNYSNEITGGSTPGGAVVRRDTLCQGTVTTTDNTKGHMWVTAPLAETMTLSGDAALNLSTQTFNGANAAATLCIAVYKVPEDISNLAATPPTLLGVPKGFNNNGAKWPKTATTLGMAVKFWDAGHTTIPAGNRLGIRIWASSASEADLVVVYDHPRHASFFQVNETD